MSGRLDGDGTHADRHQQLDLRPSLPYVGPTGHGSERDCANDQPPGIQSAAVPQAGDGFGLGSHHHLSEESPAPDTLHPAARHVAEQVGPVLERFEDVLLGLMSNADLQQQLEAGAAQGINRLEERLGTIEAQLDQLPGNPSHHMLPIFFSFRSDITAQRFDQYMHGACHAMSPTRLCNQPFLHPAYTWTEGDQEYSSKDQHSSKDQPGDITGHSYCW